VDVDPLASMRCWAIDITLGGRTFEIPAVPAVDWWPVLASMKPSGVLDLLMSTDTELDAMLLDGRVTGAELTEAAIEAIEEATGRSVHASFVLAIVGNDHWQVLGGQVAQAGFRWDVQPIGAALDLIYALIMEGLPDKAARDKFLGILEDESLTRPSKKRTPSERVVAEFEAMAGPRPKPAPVPGRSTAEPSGSALPRSRPRPRQPRQDVPSGAPRPRP